jgi:hypothetical protein
MQLPLTTLFKIKISCSSVFDSQIPATNYSTPTVNLSLKAIQPARRVAALITIFKDIDNFNDDYIFQMNIL